MRFNVSKCAKLSIRGGKQVLTNNIELDKKTSIRELNNDDNYKYLGISESAGISHSKMKKDIKKEYIRRLRMILKSQLNAKNKISAINSLAVPIISYSFTIVNWTDAEIIQIDRKTRKLLTCHGAHHPKADVDRLYLKRADGGRGLLQIEITNKITVIGMQEYLESSSDWMMGCVAEFEKKKKLYSISAKSEKFKSELDIDKSQTKSTPNATENAKNAKTVAKKAAYKQLQSRWRSKPLHGKFAERASHADVSHEFTFSWLKSSSLRAETEGFICAAQDQSLKTRNYMRNIMKISEQEPNCRYCSEHLETIDHLVSGCPVLAKKEYLVRHNKVARYIHWKICRHFKISVAAQWYEHDVPPVLENKNAKILWDFGVQTDKTIKANRPDIIIHDKINKQCTLIDVSIPTDRNTSVKTFEKLSKYKELAIEVEKMWKIKTKTVPIIIGALGVVNRNTINYVKQLPGELCLQEIQKIALLGTAFILRKALSLNTVSH